MEVDGVYEDSHVSTVFAKNEILDSLWAPNSSLSFHGSSSMVNFEDEKNAERERPFFDICKSERFNDDDESYEDEYSGFNKPAGKKRRLMPEQVLFLEKSFDVENKLEPDRKTQLAKQLGLQPRQVAIWFQNRRARSKTKVLEREYGSLKANYDKLKQDYDTLFKENEAMKAEVHLLTEKLVMREKVLSEKPVVASLDLLPKNVDAASNSAKSDVFDSESSHYNTLMEGGADYSSRVFEVEGSGEFSQEEEEDGVSGVVPKIEGEEWCGDDHDLQPNSGNLGFPVQHQGTWLWQY